MNRLWNVDSLLPLLRTAGEIALREWAKPAVELKLDRSVVTAADKEIEELFARQFDHPESGTFLIGEETIGTKDEQYVQQALQGTTYVVDPIDGTAPYVAHLPLWGCSIGLMEHGILTEGLNFFPEYDELFITCNGTLFLVTGILAGKVEMLPFTAQKTLRDELRPISFSQIALKRGWQVKFDHEAFVFSSCLGSFYHLLHGDLHSIVQDCKLWDLAAGMVILKAAGYAACHADGSEFSMDVLHSGDCDLAPDAPVRFRYPKTLVIAADRAEVQWVWSQIETDCR